MAGGSGRETSTLEVDSEFSEQGAFVDINVTPLVDIFLVLLVILMATSTAILEAGQGAAAGFTVDLPGGSADDSELGAKPEDFVIAIPVEGPLVVRGEPVSFAELDDLLAKVAGEDRNRMVLVQADEAATHRRVVQVMTSARKAGLRNLAIATRPE